MRPHRLAVNGGYHHSGRSSAAIEANRGMLVPGHGGPNSLASVFSCRIGARRIGSALGTDGDKFQRKGLCFEGIEAEYCVDQTNDSRMTDIMFPRMPCDMDPSRGRVGCWRCLCQVLVSRASLVLHVSSLSNVRCVNHDAGESDVSGNI